MLATTHTAKRPGRKGRKQSPKNGGGVTRNEVAAMIRSNLALNIEKKVTYVTQNGGIDYNGTIFSATAALVRGDDAVDQFTGNVIRPFRLVIRGVWDTNQTYSSCRFIVFQWLDASVPTAPGILQTTGSQNAPQSPLKWTNVHKIHVLYDERTVLAPVAGSHMAGMFNCMLTNCFRNIQFPVGGTAPQMNGIYMLAINDDGAPAYPQLLFHTELEYTDA